MRWIPALLLIATPLLAQEQAEETRRLAEAKEAYDKRIAEMRRLVEDLRAKSEAKREEAIEALRRANASLDELLPLIAEAIERAGDVRETDRPTPWGGGARTLVVGSEVISGSADGTDYTLKSLGDGKYELTATKRAEDGRLMEETKDQGTLKELQEEYAFLRSGLAIDMSQLRDGRFTIKMDPRLYKVQQATGGTSGKLVWNWGDTAAWGGGGQVGVTVVAPSEDLRFHLQLPEGAGFVVRDVAPGSRAEEIGIRRMDVLLRLDGELIDSPVQLKKLNERTGVLELIRRSETRKIDLATAPSAGER